MQPRDAPAVFPVALRSLRQRWILLALASAGSLWVGHRLLAQAWSPDRALQWTTLAGLTLSYLLGFIFRRLEENRRQGERALLPSFGPGTVVSLVRSLCLGWTAGFLFSPWPPGLLAWAPVVVYTTAIALDYVDGYLARRSRHATRLGEALDVELDALGLLLAALLAIGYGTLPWWFLPFGLARYAFLFGLWFLRSRGRPTYDLPESKARRPIAGITMGFMSAMLWPIVPRSATTMAGVLFAAPFLASFGRDWLVVSGGLDPASDRYHRLREGVLRVTTRWLPLPLRALTVAAIGLSLARKVTQGAALVGAFTRSGYPEPGALVAVFGIIELTGLVLVSLGAAGRIASFVMIVVVGLTIAAAGPRPEWMAALAGSISLLILGTGPASIWKPEREIFGRRRGSSER